MDEIVETNRMVSIRNIQFPLVSVVIPCYNAEKWIGECVNSVLMQDYKNIEIIVVDDASTDTSKSRIIMHPLIKLIRNEVNLGECKTSTIGFREAKGKYICRLSADDAFVNPDHISIQISEMEKHNLDWCYNNVNVWGATPNTGTRKVTSWMPTPVKYNIEIFSVFDNVFLKFPFICYLILTFRNPVNSSAMMVRESKYKELLTWDSELRTCCDGILVSKMLLSRLKGKAIDSVGAFYRVHPEQATCKPETNKSFIRMREMMHDEIRCGNHPIWMKAFSKIIRWHYGH